MFLHSDGVIGLKPMKQPLRWQQMQRSGNSLGSRHTAVMTGTMNDRYLKSRGSYRVWKGKQFSSQLNLTLRRVRRPGCQSRRQQHLRL